VGILRKNEYINTYEWIDDHPHLWKKGTLIRPWHICSMVLEQLPTCGSFWGYMLVLKINTWSIGDSG
jgi:hypothetical protein